MSLPYNGIPLFFSLELKHLQSQQPDRLLGKSPSCTLFTKQGTFPYLLLTRDPYLKAWNRPGWWERNAWIMYPKYPAVLDMHNPKSGTPNENIVQNQLNRALLSVF